MVASRSLASQLFRLIVGWYLLLAITVTGVQLGLEYATTRKDIAADLIVLGNSFSRGVADALWTYDQPLLESLAKGVAQTQIVTGVKIENSQGKVLVSEGHIPGPDEPVSSSYLAPYLVHDVPLWSVLLVEGRGERMIGKMSLYSDRSVVFERVKYSFMVILINSMIKTTGLWLVFYWAITWRLSRPLTKLSRAVSDLHLEPGEDNAALIEYPHHDEVGVLVGSINEMRDRLSLSHRELEQKVAERTAELKEANAQLQTLSERDGLTGIANRRKFDTVWNAEVHRASRQHLPLAVVMIDIDHFKRFNDHYGHHGGDDCLRQVAQALAGAAYRANDLVARYGGEEFVVVLPGLTSDEAAVIAERLREAVVSKQIPHTKNSAAPVVTISVGVASGIPDDMRQPHALLDAADAALYRAKQAGRNRVELSI